MDFFFFWCCLPTCAGNIMPERTENGGWGKDVDKVDLAEQSLLNKLIRRSLVRNRNQVEVLQQDPTSPLYSVKTFEELRLWVFFFLKTWQTVKHIYFPTSINSLISVNLTLTWWSIIGNLSCWKVFTTWGSTDLPGSRRMLYPWWWHSRKFYSLKIVLSHWQEFWMY